MSPPHCHCADDGKVHERPQAAALFAVVPGQGGFGRRCNVAGLLVGGQRRTSLKLSNKHSLTKFHRAFDSASFRRQSLRTLACCCGCCPRLSPYSCDPRPAGPLLEEVPVFPPRTRLLPPSTPARRAYRGPHVLCSGNQGRLDRRCGRQDVRLVDKARPTTSWIWHWTEGGHSLCRHHSVAQPDLSG